MVAFKPRNLSTGSVLSHHVYSISFPTLCDFCAFFRPIHCRAAADGAAGQTFRVRGSDHSGESAE
jgi:hypothetical protein